MERERSLQTGDDGYFVGKGVKVGGRGQGRLLLF